jgi:hypothetical protein
MRSAIGCVAVLGPDNAPLLIRKIADEHQDFEFDTIIFCAIDSFGQPMGANAPRKSMGRLIGPFPSADGQTRFQVWGYKASLGYKIIVLAQPPVAEIVIRGFCERVRDAVFDRITDPFYEPFSPMDAPAILSRISRDAEGIVVPTA